MAAIKTLYGAPSTSFYNSWYDDDALWNKLEAADKKNEIIVCNTTGSNHYTTNEVGLAHGHIYTVLGVVKIKDDAGKEVKLVKMRNPWGAEYYHSDYSDSSSKWTS